ncbi:dTMP kinase [Patescibacteria group bacterium]|nr:dTMP kinase [Patescibacteria group bacterium]
MDKRGTFVVFEGGEGSGKDTHIERLKSLYPEVVYTREPGGTKIGEHIRELLLAKESTDMDVRSELLLFLAARAQLMAEVIAPALTSGKNVVSNRFGLSTIAYQIYGRERQEYLPFLRDVSTFIVEKYIPDVYLLLDVTPQVGIKRAGRRAEGMNRFDVEQLTFHKRVHDGYKKHIGELGRHFIINADQPLEAVWQEVKKAVASVL